MKPGRVPKQPRDSISIRVRINISMRIIMNISINIIIWISINISMGDMCWVLS